MRYTEIGLFAGSITVLLLKECLAVLVYSITYTLKHGDQACCCLVANLKYLLVPLLNHISAHSAKSEQSATSITLQWEIVK